MVIPVASSHVQGNMSDIMFTRTGAQRDADIVIPMFYSQCRTVNSKVGGHVTCKGFPGHGVYSFVRLCLDVNPVFLS